MKCNKCGQEFGKGETCQNCGADKVSALGEFSGYSTPKARPANGTKATSSPSAPFIEPVASQICWKCGEIIPMGKFCPACGQQLLQKCPKCKESYSAKYNICPNCGTNRLTYKLPKQEQLLHEKLEKEITYPDCRDAYDNRFWATTTRFYYASILKPSSALNEEPLPKDLKKTAGPSLASMFYYKGFRLTGSIGSVAEFIVYFVEGRIVHIETRWNDFNYHAAYDYYFNSSGNLERKRIGNPEKGSLIDELDRRLCGKKGFADFPIESVIEILDSLDIIEDDEKNN